MIAGAWVCLLAPLAGALAITFAGTRISRTTAAWISTGSVFAGFAGALVAFIGMLGEGPEERSHLSTAYTWLGAGEFEAAMQILVDPVSLTMMLIVTGVGGLIVWYSVGYMHGEDEERRYFAYMALFVFSMLMLVMGGNLLLLLVGWGLVGLASYLLIAKIGSLDFATAFAAAEEGELSSSTVNLVALGLLGGAIAKSAQLPLHTWLPDAMEGPTPVSALIHAATMVTAGVYLIVRTHPIFEAASGVQHLAAVIGAVTLLVAGLIALVQWDIKRVIAYSTMSQIGYMFLGAGVGAYGFTMFHLFTHAFFKALLFLAAGLVIHRLAGEQDIRKMGGLRKLMPTTSLMFAVGTLALMGIPPLSGFWSKDAILASALATGGFLGWFLYVAGLAGAVLTGLYALRLYLIVFEGEPSAFAREHAGEHAAGDHAHAHGEGPRSMLIPVGVLTALAAISGFLEIPGVFTGFADWLDHTAEPLVHPSVAQDYFSSPLAVIAALAGAVGAWLAFKAGRDLVRWAGVREVFTRKFYVDELYEVLFCRPAELVANRLRERVEAPLVQGSLGEIATRVRAAGDGTARLQTGLLRSYALVIAGSVAVLVVVFLAVR